MKFYLTFNNHSSRCVLIHAYFTEVIDHYQDLTITAVRSIEIVSDNDLHKIITIFEHSVLLTGRYVRPSPDPSG
jgi:hypothetical protein